MIGLDVLLGGLTGLLGTALTEILKYKNQKVEYEHEEKMVALEAAAMKEEAQMNIAVTKAEIEGAVELADAQAYKESLKAGQKQLFSDKWIDRLFSVEGKVARFFAIPAAILIAMAFAFVDWLGGFMRPVLTIYLTAMSSVITWMAWEIIQKNNLAMTATEAVTIYNNATSIVIYLTVSCVTWWFGDRTMAKAIMGKVGKGGKKIMGWFRKEPPPPPPPPPPRKVVPNWINIATPIIFAIFIGLISIVYNGLAEELKTKADKEITLEQIQANQKILEKHQTSLDETLKIITKIQADREAQEKYGGVQTNIPQNQSSILRERPPLSPQEFQQYLRLSPSDRAAFRQLHPSYEALPK